MCSGCGLGTVAVGLLENLIGGDVVLESFALMRNQRGVTAYVEEVSVDEIRFRMRSCHYILMHGLMLWAVVVGRHLNSGDEAA